MKRLLKKFISVFAVLVIVFSVVAVPVSAEFVDIAGNTWNYNLEDIQTYKSDTYTAVCDWFNNLSNTNVKYDATITDLSDVYMVVCNYYSESEQRNYLAYYFLTSDAELVYENDSFYLVRAYDYYKVLVYYKDGQFNFRAASSFLDSKYSFFYIYKSNDFCYIVDFQSKDITDTVKTYSDSYYSSRTTDYKVYTNVFESERNIDIKVNVDNVSDTLPVSVDLSENPDFYIDITNNTENAIQFVAWISDTPASSGAYSSYSRLNWTYSMQQWVYLYHGTWSGVDTARTVLDIYGDVVDTADLFGLAWWKDYLVGAVDDALPKAYYSRENLSSPYHVVTPGSKFNQKFSFNTATLSKDKEYYFNIVYRQVVSYEVIDGAIVLLNSAFHDNFEDLNYYDLGYCTAFSLTADTTSDGSTSTDTNVKFPSGFDGVIDNTKNPSASIDADGNISLSGGNNDLNNSINFSPKIDNSNYNGGVTINNNLGGSGSGAGSYGDFDGDVSQLNKLLHTCTSFFGFLKAGLTAFIPSESIFTVLFSSAMLVIVFLRIWGR